MSENKYRTIIGAEIHIELNTKSKMFCGCKNDPFNANKPNIYTCPVCLGLPGALPTPNIKAIDQTIKLGLALGCSISDTSSFDRKHYFYPDLPKGYQISQQAKPLCVKGQINTSKGRIRINRVHLEEDTAKLIHDSIKSKPVSLIDFNRSGVPLVEIVTEPDIKSSSQAKEFLKSIRAILRRLNISDADMEKGSLRLEANISLSKDNSLPNYKVEIKNINSFRYYVQAVEFEISRQLTILNQGKTPKQETRGWNQDKQETVSQRSKESAQEYGYFSEPDIPPLTITKKRIDKIKKDLPILPQQEESQLISAGIRKDYASQISLTSGATASTLKAIKLGKKEGITSKDIVNLIINSKIDMTKTKPEDIVAGIKAKRDSHIINTQQLTDLIDQVIKANPTVVADYKSGKTQALGFLMGQIMKLTKGKAHAKTASKLLKLALK